jgi:hypothetical protein
MNTIMSVEKMAEGSECAVWLNSDVTKQAKRNMLPMKGMFQLAEKDFKENLRCKTFRAVLLPVQIPMTKKVGQCIYKSEIIQQKNNEH